jgi:hypothetical protein
MKSSGSISGLTDYPEGHLPCLGGRRYALFMPTTADAKKKYRCFLCDATEQNCQCDRYCCLCQSMMEIHLGQDGLYYCQSCREACEY